MVEVALLALVLMRSPPPAPPGSADTVEFGSYHIETPELHVVGEGPTKVSVESQNAAPRASAFSLRVSIDNSLGPEQKLRLGYRGNQGIGATSVTCTVELRAGERRHLDLPIAAEMNVGTLEVEGPGARGSQSVYFNVLTPLQHAVLVLGQSTAFEAYAGAAPQLSEADEPQAHVRALVVAAAEAPTHAMSYSGYELVVVPDPAVFEGLGAAQRTALETYVLAGGTLVMPPTTSASPLPLFTSTSEQRYGLGTVTMTEGPLSKLPVRWAKPLLSPRADPPHFGDDGTGPWQLLPQATPPVGIFLVIIVAFTLVIGPGSVWVARRRGPMALLVTIPSVAAVTCALIVAFSLLVEGFSVHSAVYSYTLLDSARSRALTLGIGGYYANRSPRSMTLPTTTTLIAPWHERYDRLGASADWGEGISLGSDFMPSRRYREWGLTSVDPTRARVSIKRVGDAWVAQNALGSPIVALNVTLDGTVYAAAGIADGAQAPLAPTAGPLPSLVAPKSAMRAGGAFFGTHPGAISELPERFDPLLDHFFGRELDEHEFIATIAGQGFFSNVGVDAELYDGLHLVRGAISP